MRLFLRTRPPRNLSEFWRRNVEIAFSRAVGDAAFARDFAAQDFAVNTQFLFANLRVSDRDAFGRAIAMPQTICAARRPARVGQIAFRVDLFDQALDALVEALPAQLLLKPRDQFVGARTEYSLESLGAEMTLNLNQHLFRKFVINLREETARLFGQTIDEARAATFVALLFKSDKTVAFEKSQVAAHAHLRYFQFSGQLPH